MDSDKFVYDATVSPVVNDYVFFSKTLAYLLEVKGHWEFIADMRAAVERTRKALSTEERELPQVRRFYF